MKKYTIKDSQGNKEIIYAKNIVDAMQFVDNNIRDSKLKDAISLAKGDWFTLRKRNDVIYKVIDDQLKSHNGFAGALTVETYRITFGDDLDDPYIIKKVGNESFRPDKWSSADIVKFNSAKEAIDWLRRQLRLTNNRYYKRDSNFRDSLDEVKNLVASAGFKVLRAYGSDDEPYITVKWDGSYSELNRKVRALKSEARKIGFKDVYTDDNDICFSRY